MADIDQIAKLLKHKDRARRAQAIKALGQSRDPRALKLLAWSAKNDPDEQVQQYARKAYNHLKAQVGPSRPTSGGGGVLGAASLLDYSERKTQERETVSAKDSPANDDTFDFGYDDEDEPPPRRAAEEDEDDGYDDLYTDHDDGGSYLDENDDGLFAFDHAEDDSYTDARPRREGPLDYEARKAIRAAMDAHLDGDDQAALKHLIEAIEIDDRATGDNEALRVAAAITDMDGQTAMANILDPDFQRSLLGMTNRKRYADDGDPDWGTAWMDIGIYGLVLTAGIVVVTLIFGIRLTPLLEDVANNPGNYPAFYAENDLSPSELRNIVTFLQLGVPVLILIAIGFSLSSIVSAIIQYVAVHFAAVNFFGGKKPSAVTIDKMFNTSSVITGVIFAILIVGILLVPASPGAYANGDADVLVGGLILVGIVLLSLVSLVGAIWQIAVLSRAQQIGFFSGCMSILVGGLILSGIQCVFQIALPILAGIINALG